MAADWNDEDPVTVLKFMGRKFAWNGEDHHLTIKDERTGAMVWLNGLQTAALRAFIKGTDPTRSLIEG